MRLSSRAAKGEAQESKKGKKVKKGGERKGGKGQVGRAVPGEPKKEVATKNTEKTKGGRREGKREGEQKGKKEGERDGGRGSKMREAIFPLADGPAFGRMYPVGRVPHGAAPPL